MKLTQGKEMSKTAEFGGLANHKGGTGKTTSCLSIAGCFAKSSNKVLVVDFDPQANATSALGIDMMSLQHSIYVAVLEQCGGYEGVSITWVILETGLESLDVAPGKLDLAVAEVLVQHAKDRAGILNPLVGKRRLYRFFGFRNYPNHS